jgi:hypothetical protein
VSEEADALLAEGARRWSALEAHDGVETPR